MKNNRSNTKQLTYDDQNPRFIAIAVLTIIGHNTTHPREPIITKPLRILWENAEEVETLEKLEYGEAWAPFVPLIFTASDK